jgi:hypothetical protein
MLRVDLPLVLLLELDVRVVVDQGNPYPGHGRVGHKWHDTNEIIPEARTNLRLPAISS